MQVQCAPTKLETRNCLNSSPVQLTCAGVLFGLTDVPGQGVYFVDDGTNTLDLLH